MMNKLPDIMFLTNNQRKMHGLPLWRKKDKRRRFYTSSESDRAVDGFLEFCNRK